MRETSGERGQVLPLVAIALVAFLGICAFSIDVGYAYYAKRQLQSAVDAAALAGAQDLPNATLAFATAQEYGDAHKPMSPPAPPARARRPRNTATPTSRRISRASTSNSRRSARTPPWSPPA